MIVVYRWDMRPPKSSTGFRVGHVAIDVSGTYMSWFPTQHGSVSSPARVGESLDDDIEQEHGPPHQIMRVGTNGKTLDEDAMRSWWWRFIASPPPWAIGSTNCAQIVIDALRAGGSDQYVGANDPKLVAMYRRKSIVWRPWQLPDYIKQINNGMLAKK